MTSKEALEHIKYAPAFMGTDIRYTTNSNSSSVYLDDIKQIEKDLEILDILKEQIVLDCLGNVMIKQCMSKVKQNKIKEWLER